MTKENPKKSNKKPAKNQTAGRLQIIEASRAMALTINNIEPAVVSAYPITPQTHIVEALAKFKADGEASYEYARAESEFAAASIILGASAAGVRVYSATSSQGLLLMNEVIYNISGLRLPIVMTCANRAISAPINIWNDQSDIMTIRDSGWILLFAANHQEAVDQHVLAYKLAEKLNLPVMVNVDGYVVTHVYEPVYVPEKKLIKKYLPAYRPVAGTFLDPKHPGTFGAFATPADYFEIRQELHEDLIAALPEIDQEYKNYQKIFGTNKITASRGGRPKNIEIIDNGFYEYYGPKKPTAVLVALGSVVGTIKEVINETAEKDLATKNNKGNTQNVGVLKIKVYRPFPENELRKILARFSKIAVIEKAISLGAAGPLYLDLQSVIDNQKVNNYIVGLGGRDVRQNLIKKIINGFVILI